MVLDAPQRGNPDNPALQLIPGKSLPHKVGKVARSAGWGGRKGAYAPPAVAPNFRLAASLRVGMWSVGQIPFGA